MAQLHVVPLAEQKTEAVLIYSRKEVELKLKQVLELYRRYPWQSNAVKYHRKHIEEKATKYNEAYAE